MAERFLAACSEEGQVDVPTPSACGEAHIDGSQCWHAAGDARRAGGACGSRCWHAAACAATHERAGEDEAQRHGQCVDVRRSGRVSDMRKLGGCRGLAAAPFVDAHAAMPESRGPISRKVGFSEVLLRPAVCQKELISRKSSKTSKKGQKRLLFGRFEDFREINRSALSPGRLRPLSMASRWAPDAKTTGSSTDLRIYPAVSEA